MRTPFFKCLLIAVCCSFFLVNAFSQNDVYWNATSTTAYNVPVNYTANAIRQINNNGTTTFLTTASPSMGYTFSLNGSTVSASGEGNFTLSAKAGSRVDTSTSTCVEIILKPSLGKKVNISNINFASRGSSTGPTAYSIQTGISEPLRQISSGTLSIDNNWEYKNHSVSVSGAINESVRIRIYAYNGTASTGSPNWRLDDIVITTVPEPMPVSWATVSAVIKNNIIDVSWGTLNETNNDHFEIQASKDGKHFKTIQSVKSKNGNSDSAQQYDVSINVSDVGGILALSFSLMLIGIGFKRKIRFAISVVGVSILFIQFVACNKSTDNIGSDNPSKLFIRIKQVDKDGFAKYSDVVQAVHE